MSLVKNFQMLARYNQRINNQLLTCCLTLSNAQLTANTNSFFPTIISYWNHLLFGDLILLGRLAKNNIANISIDDFSKFPTPKSPQDVYYNNLADIAQLREQLDRLIIQYCQQLTDEECRQSINYQTTEGQPMTKVVADVTQHIFNHQTHHRGQLTCILSQFNVDYGSMDLPVIVPEGS
ncbi:DinB family protein [Colwellia asteriadis]|uniref:DinB family protein n=1 Tax=Colwellia asteriadis TaxID=517723 RepID=A0ABN1L9A5_9GAMM